jgi:uncharacterized protein (TIGR02594 family)
MNAAYELAKKEVGVVEWGKGDNPKIVAYFKDAGHPQVTNDETAWCAAFVGAMLKRAGYKPSGQLTARSYLDWGLPVVSIKDAQPGDIVVIPRGNSAWQGHVFFLHQKKGAFVDGLGGNQKNSVNVQSFPVSKILAIRRPPEAKKPGKVVPVSVAAGGIALALSLFWEKVSAFFNSLF